MAQRLPLLAALPAMVTDEQLILEFQQGSADAFRELFSRYRQPVYAFFRRRLDHPARAEELAQETFLAVLRARERYEPRATFRSYLYGIAMNLLHAERRRAGREVSDMRAADPPASGDTEAVLCVRQAIAQLDETDREVVMLREFEQLSYVEIAVLAGIPLNTVRSRLFRARMRLKELLTLEPRGDFAPSRTAPVKNGGANPPLRPSEGTRK